jgi:hypothetical protein
VGDSQYSRTMRTSAQTWEHTRDRRPPLGYYFLTSPGAGVGLGAPELSFSAGILCEPAAPVVGEGDGFAFVPPVEPLGFLSTAPPLPPACSSICLVVP